MKRLYLIGLTTALVILMWFTAGMSNATLLPIQSKSKVTNGMVEDKMMPYVKCMNTELILVKEAFNGPMKGETASANTVRIVKGCDGHLKGVLKWLRVMGEPVTKINNWANKMRQQYLDEVFEYLTTGMIARKREHRDGSSHNQE